MLKPPDIIYPCVSTVKQEYLSTTFAALRSNQIFTLKVCGCLLLSNVCSKVRANADILHFLGFKFYADYMYVLIFTLVALIPLQRIHLLQLKPYPIKKACELSEQFCNKKHIWKKMQYEAARHCMTDGLKLYFHSDHMAEQSFFHFLLLGNIRYIS